VNSSELVRHSQERARVPYWFLLLASEIDSGSRWGTTCTVGVASQSQPRLCSAAAVCFIALHSLPKATVAALSDALHLGEVQEGQRRSEVKQSRQLRPSTFLFNGAQPIKRFQLSAVNFKNTTLHPFSGDGSSVFACGCRGALARLRVCVCGDGCKRLQTVAPG